MTHTVTAVEFPGHGGTVLRGELYRPGGTGPYPAVAMAHGFSATRTMGLPAYAAAIAEAGIAALLYDHRNFGDSDGEPRQEINPWAQARDYQYALDHLAADAAIDTDRLGLWGSSFSGGESIVVAAVDPRVKAVVTLVPWAGNGGEPEPGAFEAIRTNLLDRSGSSWADVDGDPMSFQVVAEPGRDGRAFLGQPEASEWFLAYRDDPVAKWQNQVTVRNAFGTDPAFDPGVAIRHLDGTPILLIVATDDTTAPAELAIEAFAAASDPKELLMIEGHHFSAYRGDALAETSLASARFLVDWLNR